MRYYKEIELPKHCVLTEAARWVAFGEVPELFPYSDTEDKCDRFGSERIFDSTGTPLICGFDEINYRDYGVESDKKYFEIIESEDYSYQFGWNMPFKEQEAYEKERGKEAYIKYCEQINRFVSKEESKLNFATDSGRAAVFSAILDGNISPDGILETDRERFVEDVVSSKYENIGPRPFKTIPRADWSLNGIDWIENQVDGNNGNIWKFVRVSVAELFKIFPSPRIFLTINAKVELYAYYLALADESPTHQIKPRPMRGRPSADLKPMVNEFERRAKAGSLPDKTEAILAEAIEWCGSILEMRVSRSTVQRRLAGILEKYAQKPAQK